MLFSDLLEETFFTISANKVRSCLTILGIVIGIGSVIALISIGQGAQSSIEEKIQSIGSNFTKEDADAIREIDFIQAVAPEILKRYQVIAKGANTNTSVIGTVPSYTQVKNLEIEIGSFISEQNIRSLSKVAVLGPTTRDDLFGENSNPVGQKIRINRVDFTIIGITQAKGGTGWGSQDDMVFIPLFTVQRFLSGDDYVSTINIQVQDEEFMTVVQDEITNLLLIRHNIADPQMADFSIMNQADILETMTEITDTLTIFLGAIAGISLVVGGIGIMNMMLTTVTERTREIGLRKAIGAKNKDISAQFLIEAVILTLIGGIIGVIFGWLISFGISSFAGINTSVSGWSIILAFGVSAMIGIGFGYYPAKRAASLNPIEALRYE